MTEENVKDTPTEVEKADTKPEKESQSLISSHVSFKNNIKIFPSKRLPNLDRGPLQAYVAAEDDSENSFAIICDRAAIPRDDSSHRYKNLNSPLVPTLKGHGVIDWPVTGEQHYVFVFENPFGHRLLDPKKPQALGWREDYVRKRIIPHIAQILGEFRNNDMLCGVINVSNMFSNKQTAVTPDKIDRIYIHECLSLPHEYDQPVDYLTIERGLAHPAGRGASDFSDDLYALGVSVAVMLRSYDPMEGLSDRERIEKKLDEGSFQALIGKNRVTGESLELMRALLADDPKQRWSIDEILSWLEGDRINQKKSQKKKLKAARPLIIGDKEYRTPENIAINLSSSGAKIKSMIEDSTVLSWIQKTIEDEDLENRYNEFAEEQKQFISGINQNNRINSLLAASFCPTFPVFYKDKVYMPDGLGELMAYHFANEKDVSVFAEILKSRVGKFWAKNTPNQFLDIPKILSNYENAQFSIEQKGVGYGMERALYRLCPNAPCYSPYLKDFYVKTPEHYLIALEKLCSEKSYPVNPADRHVIAFLNVRDKAVSEGQLTDLNSTEIYIQNYTFVKVIAKIQKSGKLPDCPNITKWIDKKIVPEMIKWIHDKKISEDVIKKSKAFAKKGNIQRYAELFDLNNFVKADRSGFTKSIKEYTDLEKEKQKLDTNLKYNKNYGLRSGREYAAVVSAVLSATFILFYLIINFSSVT